MAVVRSVFGARGQVLMGSLFTVVALGSWAYWTFLGRPTVAVVFHISMFFGVVACYAIVATGLGYRATERVESQVADVEHAEKVEVT